MGPQRSSARPPTPKGLASMRLRIYTALLLAVVLAGLLAGSARADVPPGEFPTDTPLHLPMVESLESVAQSYWAARGIALPSPVEVFWLANRPDGGAFGEPGYRVWLTPSFLGRRGIAARQDLCMAYVHERGHNAGLAHNSGDPIMKSDPWLGLTEIPPKCFWWSERDFKAALR